MKEGHGQEVVGRRQLAHKGLDLSAGLFAISQVHPTCSWQDVGVVFPSPAISSSCILTLFFFWGVVVGAHARFFVS